MGIKDFAVVSNGSKGGSRLLWLRIGWLGSFQCVLDLGGCPECLGPHPVVIRTRDTGPDYGSSGEWGALDG